MPRLRAHLGVVALCCSVAAGCGDDNPQTPPVDTAPPQVTVLRPTPEEIVGSLLVCDVTAADAAGVDSVYVSLQDSLGVEVRSQAFGAMPPFGFTVAADLLPLGRYSVCGRAIDDLGNRSTWTCAVARVYPPVTLRRDDGEAEDGLFIGTPVQTAGVFENPYDVPVMVQSVELYIWGGSAIDAPFRVVLWNVIGDTPADELEGTALRLFRGPFGARITYEGFHSIIPAHGQLAAGLQQTANLPLILGYDIGTVPPARTYWFATPAGSNDWFTLESSPAGGLETPFIRVSIRATGQSATQLAPAAPARPAPAVPARPRVASEWHRVH